MIYMKKRRNKEKLMLELQMVHKSNQSDKPWWYFSGPAGTGKTESVKALGHQLGRFVLVFNCDERFDFQVIS